jgi:chitinase
MDHNAPLRDSPGRLSVEQASNYWNLKGMPKEKIIVGLATYGRTWSTWGNFTLQGLPGNGAGTAGVYSGERGFLAYYEICEKLEKKKWTKKWLKEQAAPYAYGQDNFVSYDDIDSISEKVIALLDMEIKNLIIL